MRTEKNDGESNVFGGLAELTMTNSSGLQRSLPSESYTFDDVLLEPTDDESSNPTTHSPISRVEISSHHHTEPLTEYQATDRRDINETNSRDWQKHTKRQKLGETDLEAPPHALAQPPKDDPMILQVEKALEKLESCYVFMPVSNDGQAIMVLAKPTNQPINSENTKDLETKLAMIYRHFHPEIKQPNKQVKQRDNGSTKDFNQFYKKAVYILNLARIQVFHLQKQFFFITNCQNLIQPLQVLPTVKPTVTQISKDISFEHWANSILLLHASSWVPKFPATISWRPGGDNGIQNRNLMINTNSAMTLNEIACFLSCCLPPTIDKRRANDCINKSNPEHDFKKKMSSIFPHDSLRITMQHDTVSAVYPY